MFAKPRGASGPNSFAMDRGRLDLKKFYFLDDVREPEVTGNHRFFRKTPVLGVKITYRLGLNHYLG